MPGPKQPKGRKPGRPALRGKRLPLGLRVGIDLKKKLKAASDASGRSQSQEAELRLEQSFNTTHSLFEALDLAYGRRWTGILLAVAQAAHMTGTRSLPVNTWNFTGCEDWVLDPFAYDQAVHAVTAILEEFKPKGDASAKPVGDYRHLPVASLESIGKGFAEDFLKNLKKRDGQSPAGEMFSAISQRLIDSLAKVRD